MNSSPSKNDARKAETLNVAVSTDTILYTPFFLAYYDNDFNDTPFGSLSVNIIGKKEDSRFKQNKLKGDGFATFCLLFGLADAAICDPSYLIYLQNHPSEVRKEFKDFQALLTEREKGILAEKYSDILKQYDIKNDLLEMKADVSGAFKKICQRKKIIGGLVSKIAFSVVGGSKIKIAANSDTNKTDRPGKKFGFLHKKYIYDSNGVKIDTTGKDFTKNNAKGYFIYYRYPSTGNCIGEIQAVIYNKKKDQSSEESKVVEEDFGKELSKLQQAGYEDSIAFTCDFVSLDFLIKNPRIERAENDKTLNGSRIVEIENLAADEERNYMFTGILGNCETNNQSKLQTLLYGIDKNLFIINQYLNDNDPTGLTKYLKNKFNFHEGNEENLLELLVADANCRKDIKEKIYNPNDKSFKFDTIIRYYVDRLFEQNLYYSKTIPESRDLNEMVKLRYHASESNKEVSDNILTRFLEEDLLSDWRKKEKTYFNYENEVNSLRLKEKRTDILTLLLAPFLIIFKCSRITLYAKLWFYISKPSYLYTIGSLFLILEVVSSLCHIFGYHIPYFDYSLSMCISETTYCIPFNLKFINNFIFFYSNITIVMLILITRYLMKLKENDRYVYRDKEDE